MNKFLTLALLLAALHVCAQSVDTTQLFLDVQILSADSLEGRRVGTPGSEKARKYLIGRLDQLGVAKLNGSYEYPFAAANGSVKGVNLIGVIPGQTDNVIVVSAHYDHLGVQNGDIYNGADDNASGVGGLLAVAAALQGETPKHTVLLVAFDAEEKGLLGARYFIENPPMELSRIRLNINMDMIAHNDKNELYAVGTYHYPQLKPMIESVDAQSEVSVKVGHDVPGTGYNDWTTASDHGVFHKKKIPFVYFGVEDHEDYHKATDTFDRINKGFYAKAAEAIIRFVRLADEKL